MTKPLHETLEGALGVFFTIPEREFDNGYKLQGLFTSEIKQAGLSKSIIKKLVKKGMLKQGAVTFEGKGQMTFYALVKNSAGESKVSDKPRP